MKKRRWIIVGVVILLVAAVALVAPMLSKKEVVFSTVAVGQQTVSITVMATGYIQPVEEVEVGTQVSGVIEKIYVDFNSHVKKGQLLAELDKLTLQEKLNQSNASLSSARSDLLNAQQNYDRVKYLYDAKAATQVNFEEATNRLNQSKTSLANAQATVHQSQVNLSYAYIYSPIDGVILERAVNMGQTVAASFNTPTLFRIAEDLKKMQVEANVDEADIGMVALGQRVTFTVDAYSGETFTGQVSQIRLQPTVTSNVVTYTVIVDAPNPEEKLFPGMTASITVEVMERTGAAVPLEATNFRMTQELAGRSGVAQSEIPRTSQGQYGVWVRRGGSVEYRPLEVGIDDGVYIIVESGVNQGEEVVLSAEVGVKKSSNKQAVANPLIPQRPRR